MSGIQGSGAGRGTSARGGRRWFMIAPVGLVALGVLALYFVMQTTLVGVQFEMGRSAPAEAVATLEHVILGSAMGFLFCGVMAAVVLLSAGKAVWALVLGAWVVTVAGAVWLVGAIVSGMTPAEVVSQIVQFPIMAVVVAAFMLVMGHAMTGLTAPFARLFDNIASFLSAVETAGGPRWGRIIAVAAAIYLVVGVSLLLFFFPSFFFWPF